MKKRFLVIALVMMMLFVTACGSSSGGGSGNSTNAADSSASDDASLKIETTSADISIDYLNSPDSNDETIMYASEFGMAIDTPKTYLDNSDKTYFYYADGKMETGMYIFEGYLYPATYDELMSMNEEDFTAAEAQLLEAFLFFKADASVFPPDEMTKWYEETIGYSADTLQELGTVTDEEGNAYTFYAYTASPEDIPEGISEELKPIYEGVISELEAAKKNIKYCDPVDPGAVDEGAIISFVSTDVDGNEVKSEDIFAAADYTMVNCWASWCGPCIGELPEIEELSKKFEEKGGQVIGILMDGSSATGLADAKEIIEETGVTYLNVIDWEGINEQIHVQAYPTTYFVDSSGTIVGSAIIGANPNGYEDTMNSLLG